MKKRAIFQRTPLLWATAVTLILAFLYLKQVIFSSEDHFFTHNTSWYLGFYVAFILRNALLCFVIYRILVGVQSISRKDLLRNSIIVIGMNFLLYGIIYWSNKQLSLQNFFVWRHFIYFVGYTVFSLFAFLVTVQCFINYRSLSKSLKNTGLYYVEAMAYILALYYLFTSVGNKLLEDIVFGSSFLNYFVVFVVSNVFFIVFYFIQKKNRLFETQIAEQSIIAENATAQFESLKNQLDPHFLFNSLNVLTSLIEEDSEKAVHFTTSLSRIYRYVLEQKDKSLVEVKDELKFAGLFLSLLQLRFENALDVQIDHDAFEEGELIVPLSLQLLLENCVKHNVASSSRILSIKIYRDNHYLVVENKYQPKEVIHSSTGIGLKNIQNRYALLTDRLVVIEQSNEQFYVKIPLLTEKIKTVKTEPSTDHKAYEIASKRAAELKKYYGHLGTYLVLGLFFFILNMVTSPFQWWFYWPMLGWGIAIGIHTLKVFGFSDEWEKRKIQEILDKENQPPTSKWK